jgi:hypothetical protein
VSDYPLDNVVDFRSEMPPTIALGVARGVAVMLAYANRSRAVETDASVSEQLTAIRSMMRVQVLQNDGLRRQNDGLRELGEANLKATNEVRVEIGSMADLLFEQIAKISSAIETFSDAFVGQILSSIVDVWHRESSSAQSSEFDSTISKNVGIKAWKALDEHSKGELRAYHIMRSSKAPAMQEAVLCRLAILALCLVLERELRAALLRDGAAPRKGLRKMVEDASGSARSPRLQSASLELTRLEVWEVRNRAAHGDRVFEQDLKVLAALLVEPEGDRPFGLIGQLVVHGYPASP